MHNFQRWYITKLRILFSIYDQDWYTLSVVELYLDFSSISQNMHCPQMLRRFVKKKVIQSCTNYNVSTFNLNNKKY